MTGSFVKKSEKRQKWKIYKIVKTYNLRSFEFGGFLGFGMVFGQKLACGGWFGREKKTKKDQNDKK